MIPSVDPVATPLPSAAPVVLAEPSGVRFGSAVVERADGSYESIYTVTWRTPRSEGLDIWVYGVKECLAMPTPLPWDGSSGPCVVEGAPMPSALLELVGIAPATEGTATWTGIPFGGCDIIDPVAFGPDGTAYYAIVLGAYYGDARHSVLAIADPGSWYSPKYEPNTDYC